MSTDNFGSWLNYQTRHRSRLIRGGIFCLGGIIIFALQQTAQLDAAPAPAWLKTKATTADAPEWWPDESTVPPQWGWTEEMGWEKDESLADLGDVADNAYARGLGFDKGAEGTKHYLDRLTAFASQFDASIRNPLLASLQHHFPQLQSWYSSYPDPAGPMIDYKNVYMTNKVRNPDPVHKWEKKNGADGWAVQFYDDEQGKDWMERHFAGTDVEQTWNWLKRPVLKADFLRYLLPMVQGGVYADTDVAPLKPIEEWGTHDVEYLDISATDGPNWRSTLRERPSVVVGLESDCHAYWHSVGGFPRPAGICQWTLSSAPYHPIMLEAVRVVVNHTRVVTEWEQWREEEVPRLRAEGKNAEADALAGERVNKKLFDVVNWTGPGAFSDAVYGFLLARYNVSWHRLRHRRVPLRIGDVLILPVTGFSPYADPDFHPGGGNDIQACVRHDFKGSWKHDGQGP